MLAAGMRKVIKIILKSIGALVGLVVLYFLFAVVLSVIPVNSDFKSSEKGVKVYVYSNGVHTDFIVPVRSKVIDWSKHLSYSDVPLADSSFQYLSFGWGDKGFFIHTKEWVDLEFSTAFCACFWLSSTAMHVNWWEREPTVKEHCKGFTLSEEKYRELADFIAASFFKDAAGKFVRINANGYWDSDCFYEAAGTYSLFNTCNSWTNRGLKKAGVTTGLWSPFDKGIMYHLK